MTAPLPAPDDPPAAPRHQHNPTAALMPADREQALGQRLMARVAQSVAAHRGFVTIRRERTPWRDQGPGVRSRALRASGGMRVELLALEPGSALPWPDDALAQEVLVLDGALSAGPGAAADGGRTTLAAAPEAWPYLVRDRTQAGNHWHADESSLVYLRHRLAGFAPDPLEAEWWDLACRKPLNLAAGRRPWTPTTPGVQVQLLCGNQRIVSMLVRFEPGASVADHHHAVDEDCLMLTGEMFLGDVLLRPLDYQLAPAGGGHFGEMSEAGGVFFFHGALDPVLTQR